MYKPSWLDTAIGVFALVVTIFSAVGLTGTRLFHVDIILFFVIGFAVLIFAATFFFRPRHALQPIAVKNQARLFEKEAKDASEIIVINPKMSATNMETALKLGADTQKKLSVVGSAPEVMEMLEFFDEKVRQKYYPDVRISGFPSENTVFCFVSEKRNKITMFLIDDKESYRMSLWDKNIIELVLRIIKKEGFGRQDYIGMGDVTNPEIVIDTIRQQQTRYLEAFESMKSGHISFYGEEVQIVQSGWVEAGKFSTIDTLDLTVSPIRLLTRARYNDANRRFIKDQGGKIRRVYILDRATLENPDEAEAFKKLCDLQSEIGVEIGMIWVDQIPVPMRRDFIIYDDEIVLLEERQANFEYTLGKSTAYFSPKQIKLYRTQFDEVWSGKVTGVTPPKALQAYLNDSPVKP